MALRNFKDIIDNKAYFVNSKDRKIFEEGDYASFFGFGDGDLIEFVVYDVNDTQLEQASGGLVRYIQLNNQNIKDYILLPDGTNFQALNFPKEYFVDIERLLNEAGFDNGIFKTQITLINRRIGGFERDNKMWISEISPSRTEIRLFPLKKPTNQDYQLDERFKIFVSDEEFRDDTIQSALAFLERINPAVIDTFLTNKYSEVWMDRLQGEYRITNIDEFCNRVYIKFLESAIFEFTNRYSDINSLLYGKLKPTPSPIKLSKLEIKSKCTNLIINSISYYLITPDFNNKSDFEIATEESLDEVSQILQRTKIDTAIFTKDPLIVKAELNKPIERQEVLELKNKIIKEVPIIIDNPPPIKEPVLETPVDIPRGGSSPTRISNVVRNDNNLYDIDYNREQIVTQIIK